MGKQIELCTREFFEQRQGYGCDDPVTHLHRRPAPRRLDAAGADSRLALAGRRHHGTGRHPAAGQRARPACERRALPGRPGAALGGRLPRLRRGLHSRHAPLPGRQQAVLHRQDAEQLPPRQPDPPDAAEREDHRCPPRTDGLLLQQLQAAVCLRPAVHLQPRGHRALLRTVCAPDGSLGLRPAGSRLARAARGRHRRPRRQRAADPGLLRPGVRDLPASSSTRTSGACTPRAPSRSAARSIARASTSGATSSRGSASCVRRSDHSRQPESDSWDAVDTRVRP